MPPPVPVVARPFRDTANDAFYIDVEGTLISSSTQCPLNKFIPQRTFLQVDNPLDASVPAANTGRPAKLTRPETIPKAQQGTQGTLHLFVPAAVRSTPPDVIRLTLHYCVGSEMNRHGLEIFFATSTDRALITVPGREAGWITPAVSWGIGITSKQIDDLFTAASMPNQKWQVEIMTGYSTGYRGVNGTINNSLLPINKLKTLIFYDALYAANEPSPGGNTKLMLGALPAGVQLVAYDVTDGGTPHPFRVALPSGAITIDLKSRFTSLSALIFARLLEKGLKDNYIKAAEVPAPVQTLIANGLPARGTLASSSVRQPLATSGTLDDWAKLAANKPAIAAINTNKTWALVRDRELMGWRVAGPGDLAHDGFIPEFGWEFLARDP
jgi:hypothetical protein